MNKWISYAGTHAVFEYTASQKPCQYHTRIIFVFSDRHSGFQDRGNHLVVSSFPFDLGLCYQSWEHYIIQECDCLWCWFMTRSMQGRVSYGSEMAVRQSNNNCMQSFYFCGFHFGPCFKSEFLLVFPVLCIESRVSAILVDFVFCINCWLTFYGCCPASRSYASPLPIRHIISYGGASILQSLNQLFNYRSTTHLLPIAWYYPRVAGISSSGWFSGRAELCFSLFKFHIRSPNYSGWEGEFAMNEVKRLLFPKSQLLGISVFHLHSFSLGQHHPSINRDRLWGLVQALLAF